jgi:lipopolysaccharide export system protein LptC
VGKRPETVSGMNRFFFRKPKVLILLFLAVIAVSAGAGFVIHRMMTVPRQISDLHIDSEAALKINAMKQISKKNGITEWELEAATATLAKERNQAILTRVRVTFHTRDKDTVLLTSDHGVLNTQTHDIDFTGNVVVKHRTYTLKTDKLQYNKKAHIIHADTKVRLDYADASMEADTMEIRINDNEVILQGHVKGQFSDNFYLP